MTVFHYSAIDTQGRRSSGLSWAPDALVLRQRLAERRRRMVACRRLGLSSGLSLADKESLFRELAALLEAGVQLVDALNLLAAEGSPQTNLLSAWKQGVERGLGFSRCLRETPELNNPTLIKMVEVGEASGELAAAVTRIADHYEGLEHLRRKVVGALVYPAIVVVVSLIAVAVLAFYVIPMFLDMFRRYHVELPLVTKLLLALTDFFTHYGPFLLLFALGLLAVGHALNWTRHPQFFRVMNALPILGETLNLYRNLSLLRNLGNLLAADIRIHEAVQLLVGMFYNPTLNQQLADASIRIQKGAALSRAFGELGLLSSKDVTILRIGEETGEIAAGAARLAAGYERRLDARLERFLALFEPVMIVALALVIGFILIALYLPLFDILGGGGRI